MALLRHRRRGLVGRALAEAWALALVIGCAAVFFVPALRRTGVWPAPLDDVYIHFDFARSIGQGHPFEWIPGNGYSSGATSLLYPLVLAPGWIVGFRGAWLGLYAALVACVCLVDLCRSLRALAGGAPGWVAALFPALVLCVPLLDWSWFSGMEVALFGAVLGRAALSVRRAEEAPAEARRRAQRRAGGMLALLVAVRPEAVALAAPLAVAVAMGAVSLGAVGSLVRAGGPAAALVAAPALANRAWTGEWAAAGAVRKLLISDPYLTRLDVAIGALKNLIALRTTALDAALGGWPLSLLVPALVGAALIDRRERRVAAALVVGALGMLGLVALNSTALFQNWRYAAPSLAMLLVAAGLGGASLARRARRRRSVGLAVVAAGGMVAAIAAPRRGFERQIDHFARASANIAEQQVEVGRRLARREPRPRRVFLSDAGAIPYFSGLPALDGLGLGGYRGMPFARASVHGVPAVIELLQRMEVSERPDVMAVYPSWWGGLADVFGKRFDAVAIEDNVICGAPEKVLFEADWSALGEPGEARAGAIDAVDVGDLVEEKGHRYAAPIPQGGWVVGAVLALASGERRFDAGRIVPQGREESFVVSAGVSEGPALLVLRTDGGPAQVLGVAIERESWVASEETVRVEARGAEAWTEVKVPLASVRRGDVVHVRSVEGAFRDFHAWIVREP
ncbi:MAG: hypothetical protein R3F14_28770 [Polyangiaceae bacterium]